MKSFSNRKWKSIFSIMFVFFTLFFLNVSSLIAETIKKYDVSIQINRNGTLTINEIIDIGIFLCVLKKVGQIFINPM